MKPVRLCLLASIALALTAPACSSTKVDQTWKAPEVTRLDFKRILVIAASPSEAFRHVAEDKVAEKIRGPEVIKSYTVLPDAESVKDKAKVDQVVAQHGIDGIVILRVVSDETEVNYVPPSYPQSYSNFSAYYAPNYGLSPYYYEGDVRTYKIYGVETNIYQAKDGKLVWSGLTKTVDPDNSEDLLEETVDKVHEELKKEKLIR